MNTTAFTAKIKTVQARAQALAENPRCNLRPPKALEWLWFTLLCRGGNKTLPVPKGRYTPDPYHIDKVIKDNTPLDRLARTFCDLEDLEAWMDRIETGHAKHAADVLTQCQHKLARLQAAATFA